ncbi:MAG: hypothetical protein AAF487_00155 [Bacteroidota bacterium]
MSELGITLLYEDEGGLEKQFCNVAILTVFFTNKFTALYVGESTAIRQGTEFVNVTYKFVHAENG